MRIRDFKMDPLSAVESGAHVLMNYQLSLTRVVLEDRGNKRLRFISQSNGKKDVAILERNTPHYLAW
ncbi:hypothetical protein X773_33310 [Mesorhizobium sp. LSJC285A00]|uniref:hypothetical protein n=1 Tax=Mesorhizobium sp. LSJC285A00 TaxID=1287338 RepID=UPI0003CE02F7|nr:hypothetical protein [Mesorhizobium sp. LSJC285A00]ESW63812.1 hypothetical protein X773_33310 [Mesorhizobium sp. LSJC285A00]